MKAVAPTTFARMSESLMSRKPLHKRLSRGFATRRSLPPIVGKNWRQKLPGGSPQGCEIPVIDGVLFRSVLTRGPLRAPLRTGDYGSRRWHLSGTSAGLSALYVARCQGDAKGPRRLRPRPRRCGTADRPGRSAARAGRQHQSVCRAAGAPRLRMPLALRLSTSGEVRPISLRYTRAAVTRGWMAELDRSMSSCG